MTPPAVHLEDRLQLWLSGWLAKQRLSTSFQVESLAGDGSPRPFYRIRVSDRTFVLLSEPAWTLSKDYPAHQGYLRKLGLPVPEFLGVDEHLGVLLMEDLGDELLQTRILAAPAKKTEWLAKAVALLAELHGKTFPVPKDLPVSTRRFDSRKFREELAFTEEHLVVGLLKAEKFSGALGSSIDTYCDHLARIEPWAFSHRDYHTRNLLVTGDQLRLIDFQDARLGPVEYDLASLFFDAYVPIQSTDRARLLETYKKSLQPYPLFTSIDWKGFGRRLEQVAFQRVVKAAGSFASFYTRYGKRTHLPYLVPALEMAKDIQDRDRGLPDLPIEKWIARAREVVS